MKYAIGFPVAIASIVDAPTAFLLGFQQAIAFWD
jgi:hypothetical protein